jgi:hypothetical protein
VILTLGAIVWGSVGEWVGGLAAAAGLFFAGYEIRAAKQERAREEEQRREDLRLEREAMARAVSITASVADATEGEIATRYARADRGCLPEHSVWYLLTYSIHNGGSLPIDDVVLSAGDVPVLPEQREALVSPESQEVIGTVAAGATVTGSKVTFFYGEPAFGEFPYLASLRFTDAWGNYCCVRQGDSSHNPSRRTSAELVGVCTRKHLHGRSRLLSAFPEPASPSGGKDVVAAALAMCGTTQR